MRRIFRHPGCIRSAIARSNYRVSARPSQTCGACRQILWEFGGDLEVVLANLIEVQAAYRLRDLLPMPFDARVLDE